jgi:hypothetical protein
VKVVNLEDLVVLALLANEDNLVPLDEAVSFSL